MNTNQTINNIMTEKTFKQINLIQSIIVIVTTILLFYCFFGSTVVKTGSMEPTIHVGSPVIYRYAEPTAMDYGDIVVHVFQTQYRDFYRLEDLWADAERTDYKDE